MTEDGVCCTFPYIDLCCDAAKAATMVHTHFSSSAVFKQSLTEDIRPVKDVPTQGVCVQKAGKDALMPLMTYFPGCLQMFVKAQSFCQLQGLACVSRVSNDHLKLASNSPTAALQR